MTVDWLDAETTCEWTDIDEARELTPAKCTTTGYLLRRDRVAIVVASSIDPENENVNAVTTIPRGMVTRVRPTGRR